MNGLIDLAVGLLCFAAYSFMYSQSPILAIGLLAFAVGNIGMKVNRILSKAKPFVDR